MTGTVFGQRQWQLSARWYSLAGAMGEERGKNQEKLLTYFMDDPPTSTQKLGWLAVELVCVLANTIAKLQNQAVLDCKNAMFFAYCNFFLAYPVRGGLPRCPFSKACPKSTLTIEVLTICDHLLI